MVKMVIIVKMVLIVEMVTMVYTDGHDMILMVVMVIRKGQTSQIRQRGQTDLALKLDRLILTQYRQVPTIAVLYWPSTQLYRLVTDSWDNWISFIIFFFLAAFFSIFFSSLALFLFPFFAHIVSVPFLAYIL